MSYEYEHKQKDEYEGKQEGNDTCPQKRCT